MSKKRETILVCGRCKWSRQSFEDNIVQGESDFEWMFCGGREAFEKALEGEGEIRYIFFLHWSEKVPESVVQGYECVCFHMTDVPYGRGGSPLQNLIVRKHRETKLTALKMTSEFDAGPVYMKRTLSLEGSSAEEIYKRSSDLSCKMAREIVSAGSEPKEQEGEVVVFRRRRPEESALPEALEDLDEVFDHIRMMDADGYPPAFLDFGKYRLEFRRATRYSDKVVTEVVWKEIEE